MIGYPKRWIGSTDPDDKSGIAVFTLEGQEYRIFLENFSAFSTIDAMLDISFRHGKEHATNMINSRLMAVIRNAVRDV